MTIAHETVVVPPDAELFLTGWLRAQLARRGFANVEVGHVEPADLAYPLDHPLVVVRNDGGNQTAAVTFNRSIGITVLGGTRQDTKPTADLARLVYALATSTALCTAHGSPFAAPDKESCSGPFIVNDSADTCRVYMALEYSLVGDFIAL